MYAISIVDVPIYLVVFILNYDGCRATACAFKNADYVLCLIIYLKEEIKKNISYLICTEFNNIILISSIQKWCRLYNAA